MTVYFIIAILSFLWWKFFVHKNFCQWKMIRVIEKRKREIEKMFDEIDKKLKKLEGKE